MGTKSALRELQVSVVMEAGGGGKAAPEARVKNTWVYVREGNKAPCPVIGGRLTCLSRVLHGRLVGRVVTEALQGQFLIFCRHFGVPVQDVDGRLVLLSALGVGPSPAVLWSMST